MLKTKKIIALALVFLMTAGAVITVHGAGETAQTQLNPNEIEVLSALELLPSDFLAEGELDAETTRAQAVNSVVRLLFNKVPDGISQLSFDDVDFFALDSGVIQVAVDLGLVSGTGNQMFEPQRVVLLSEAVKMLVSALGYDLMAQSQGGYPAGYMAAANRIGLLKGVQVNSDTALTRQMFLHLLYCALSVDMMKQISYGAGDNRYTIEKGVTVLSQRRIEKITGIVTGTAVTQLNEAQGVGDGKIRVNDAIYSCGERMYDSLLGYHVELYSKNEGGINKAICVVPDEAKNRVLELKADQISACRNNVLVYWREDKISKVNLSVYKDVIYNGRMDTAYIEADFLPKSGGVKLLDHNSDGIYDVVFITDYTNFFVKSKNAETLTIYDAYQSGALVLEPSETDQALILKDGVPMDFGEILAKHVLTAEISKDKKVVKVHISDAKITGTVQSMQGGSDLEEKKVVIDQITYRLAPSLLDTDERIRLNDVGTYYLDFTGAIAAFDLDAGMGHFGYVVNCIHAQNSFDATYQLKILDQGGKVEEYSFSTKVTVNGERGNGEYAFKALCVDRTGALTEKFYPQLIYFNANTKGEITNFKTVNSDDKDLFALDYAADSADGMFTHTRLYKGASSVFALQFGLSADTVIFDVPKLSETEKAEDKDYEVRGRDVFSNDRGYIVEGYCTDDVGFAKAVVNYKTLGSESISTDSPYAIVDEVASTLDEDGMPVSQLRVLVDGVSKQIMAEENVKLTDASGTALKRGTILRYQTNGRGKLSSINVVVNPHKEIPPFSVSDADPHVVDGQTYGQIYSKNDSYIRVCYKQDSVTGLYTFQPSDMRTFQPSYGPIYVYDKKRDIISSASDLSDAADYLSVGHDAAHVFIHTQFGETRQSFLFLD